MNSKRSRKIPERRWKDRIVSHGSEKYSHGCHRRILERLLYYSGLVMIMKRIHTGDAGNIRIYFGILSWSGRIYFSALSHVDYRLAFDDNIIHFRFTLIELRDRLLYGLC